MTPSSTNRAWRKFGEEDPYFVVLSQPRFRQEAITEKDLEAFFQSGEEYVDQMLAMASERVDAPRRFRNVLDFGCGVGRLTLPLAAHAENVLGVDISPSMLSEARKNCEFQGVTNAKFVESEAWMANSTERFDLVHTFIVLQHISPNSGFSVIANLMECLTDEGVGVIHLTYGKSQRGIRLISWIKKWVPLAHNVINVLRGRPFRSPMMQMNDYDLNQVFQLLQQSGVSDFNTQFTDHGGYLGVSLYFKKPAANSAALAA